MLVNKDFLTWLLIGWRLAASQSDAMFENLYYLTWILTLEFLTAHCQGVSVSPTNQMTAFILIDSPQYPTRATWCQWRANVLHKCTLVRFFCKVNNFELMNNFSHWCTASNLEFSNSFLNIFHRFFDKQSRLNNKTTIISFEFNHKLYKL